MWLKPIDAFLSFFGEEIGASDEAAAWDVVRKKAQAWIGECLAEMPGKTHQENGRVEKSGPDQEFEWESLFGKGARALKESLVTDVQNGSEAPGFYIFMDEGVDGEEEEEVLEGLPSGVLVEETSVTGAESLDGER